MPQFIEITIATAYEEHKYAKPLTLSTSLIEHFRSARPLEFAAGQDDCERINKAIGKPMVRVETSETFYFIRHSYDDLVHALNYLAAHPEVAVVDVATVPKG